MPPRTAAEILMEMQLRTEAMRAGERAEFMSEAMIRRHRTMIEEANNMNRFMVANPNYRTHDGQPTIKIEGGQVVEMLDQKLRLANDALRAQVADLQKVNKELKAALSKIDNTPLPFSPRHRTLDVRVDQMQEMRAHRIMAGMMFDERTMEEFITNDAMLQEYARQIAKSLRQEAKKLYNRTGSESGQFPF